MKIEVNGGTGMASLNVRGSYGVDITTNWPGRCAWTAKTGDTTYPVVAPGPVQLTVTPDAAARGSVRVAVLGARASLGNGYLGTACSTGIAGEPSALDVGTRTVPTSTFRRKRVTLRLAGTSVDESITFTWSTKLLLKRARR